jgi:uncharacterized oxidoreductase
MKISGNTIFITGGATGIGLAMSEIFLNAGNEVIICGRREDKLLEAEKKLKGIHTKVCDLSVHENRIAISQWVISKFPDCNMLINNAGIQRMIDFTKGTEELTELHEEISTNLEAPIHLSALFIPHLSSKKDSAIVNITSGLGFTPLAFVPVYCATKAALHSFSLTLRHQLRNSSIKVFEIIPPIVDTDLDKGARKRRGQKNFGISPQETAQQAVKAIENNEFEFAIGMAQNLKMGSRNNPEEAFKRMNG